MRIFSNNNDKAVHDTAKPMIHQLLSLAFTDCAYQSTFCLVPSVSVVEFSGLVNKIIV